jgi:microcystin-dependent protein
VSLIVLNAGEQAFLQNGVTGVGYVLRLYKTDVTAGLTPPQIDALTQAAFTEATFTGYSAAAVATGGWTVTQGNPTRAVNVEKQFTSSANQAAQNIWGYYVTRTSDGAAMWFEQFPAPVVIEDLNDRIDVIPTMTLDDAEGNGLEVGDIIPTARATAAPGRLLCQGQAVSRSTFATLFAAIGTVYGVGDGSTTFNVPNLQQRFPLGKATSGTGATLGGTGGNIDHTHPLDTATSHAKITAVSGSANNLDMARKTVASYNSSVEGDLANTGGFVEAQTSGVSLGGSSDTGNPPFQVVNFEIVAS